MIVILGTFFPWKARTLVVVVFMPAAESGGGMVRCRWSCCRSFVVVIFVNNPATISITSPTGMLLISYRRLSSYPLRFRRGGVCACKQSSLANSTTWPRLRSRIGGVSSDARFARVGESDVRESGAGAAIEEDVEEDVETVPRLPLGGREEDEVLVIPDWSNGIGVVVVE